MLKVSRIIKFFVIGTLEPDVRSERGTQNPDRNGTRGTAERSTLNRNGTTGTVEVQIGTERRNENPRGTRSETSLVGPKTAVGPRL